MPGEKGWEVCLYSDSSDYQVWCKNFHSFRRARRFMETTFRKTNDFYCATIANGENTAFFTYYWNGRLLIAWDKPWVLSRRQLLALDGNGGGRGGAGPSDKE